MLFNTSTFIAFFLCFYVLYFLVANNNNHRLWLIAVASIFFYGTWDYKFIPVLVGTGIVDFYLAQAIAESASQTRRRALLATSVTMNLLVLGAFKYTNFLLTNVGSALSLFGVSFTPPIVKIFVPLGISFYTFQSISYTFDVFNGAFAPRRRLLEFIASLTFFPHLVAGPIVRASFLLPQFEHFHLPKPKDVRRGFLVLAAGLLKKTIADLLADNVEALFSGPGPHSALQSWTGALAFAAQVYGDFAGYTDMAIGISLLLGFRLPPNFNLPYLSTSPADFWRRWHISLSSWLRDYCYMPLALRNGRVLLALFITMFLCGLWHGAKWTFVLFGLYHGVLLAASHALQAKTRTWNIGRGWRVVQVLLTFYLILIGFVLFRAESLTEFLAVLRGMHHANLPSVLSYGALIALVLTLGALIFCHAIDYVILRKPEFATRGVFVWPITVIAIASAVLLGPSGQLFIYFQF